MVSPLDVYMQSQFSCLSNFIHTPIARNCIPCPQTKSILFCYFIVSIYNTVAYLKTDYPRQ